MNNACNCEAYARSLDRRARVHDEEHAFVAPHDAPGRIHLRTGDVGFEMSSSKALSLGPAFEAIGMNAGIAKRP